MPPSLGQGACPEGVQVGRLGEVRRVRAQGFERHIGLGHEPRSLLGDASVQDELEQVDIDRVAVALLDAGAGPSVADDPERALEVPHGVAPAELVEEPEQVAEPAQGVGVGVWL